MSALPKEGNQPRLRALGRAYCPALTRRRHAKDGATLNALNRFKCDGTGYVLAMDRAQASRLVGKLQALAADPAATEAEKALAGAKAEALSARFRLGVAEERRPRVQARRRYRIGRIWLLADSEWGSSNIKIEHWRNEWRITVDIGWVTRRASWDAAAARGDVTRGRKSPPRGPKGSPSDAGS